MAKLTRESRLRERKLDKQARKDARRQAAESSTGPEMSDALDTPDEFDAEPSQTTDVPVGQEH
jgi:hypothetical protein